MPWRYARALQATRAHGEAGQRDEGRRARQEAVRGRCADRCAGEAGEVAEQSESVVQGMMGFKGR